MNDMSQNERVAIGGNNPPEPLLDTLHKRHKSLLDKFIEHADVAKSVPVKIVDDETHAKAIELIRLMREDEAMADAMKKLERKPFNDSLKIVNNVFETRIEASEKLRTEINARHLAYSQVKADAERRRLEEIEEASRAAAKKAEDEAAAAEQRRIEAERAEQKAIQDAKDAEDRRLKAIQDAKDAEERAEKAKAEEKRLAEERKERERLEKIQADQKKERDEKEEAERLERKRVEDEAMAAARKTREEEEAKAVTAKAEAKEAKQERDDANEEARESRAEAKVAKRDETQHMGEALREEKRADRIADKVAGPVADLARSRSEHGATGTIASNWKSWIVDKKLLDKEALWNLIATDAIDVALRKWMLLQPIEKRSMPGAVMEIEQSGRVM